MIKNKKKRKVFFGVSNRFKFAAREKSLTSINKKELFIFWLFAVVIRFLSANHDFAPFSFCDEDLIINELARMKMDETWITNFFLSGGLNIYPILIIDKILNFFFSIELNLALISRIFAVVLVGSLTSVFVYLTTFEITKNVNIARLGILLFIFSPAVYSQSRYFYPDHWIYFFSSVVFFLILKSFENKSAYLIFLNGAIVGLAASLKYTGFYLLFPVVLGIVSSLLFDKARITLKNFFLKVSVLFFGTSIIFVLLNFSALIRPESFRSQFLANAENYGVNQGDILTGSSYYLLIFFFLILGIFGWLFIVTGFLQIWKLNKKIFFILFTTIMFYLLYMGSAELVINRNMNILFPLMIPIMAVGIDYLYQRTKVRFSKKIAMSLVFVLLFQPGYSFFYSMANDFQIDSRQEAINWLKQNIPADEVIGVEQTCWPHSPAQVAGFTVVVDKDFSTNKKYYVLTSYWSDPLVAFYRSNNLYQILLDQKYIHFYNFNDKNLFFQFNNKSKVNEFLPKNYSVLKVINFNGPVVYILKRNE